MNDRRSAFIAGLITHTPPLIPSGNNALQPQGTKTQKAEYFYLSHYLNYTTFIYFLDQNDGQAADEGRRGPYQSHEQVPG